MIRMAKAAPKKAGSVKKSDAYEVKGDSVTRKKPQCPKCGAGVSMATHKDRVSCGRCGYTEFSKKE